MDLHNSFYDSCMIYALFNIASQRVEAGQRNFKTAVVSTKCFAGHTKFFHGPFVAHGPRVRHLCARSPERLVLSWRLRSPSAVSTHFGLCSRSKNEALLCSTLRLGRSIVSAVNSLCGAQTVFTAWVFTLKMKLDSFLVKNEWLVPAKLCHSVS